MSLNQVSRPGSGSGSDNRALLAADQRSPYGACNSSDNRALGLAMVMTMVSPGAMRGAGIAGFRQGSKQQGEGNHHCQNAPF
jgi:hypothetical protein